MKKIILSQDQVQELIFKNRYRVDEKTKFFSRCIDGRYPNEIKNLKFKIKNSQLPALAFPGGDVGELALLVATANAYGFTVYLEKALKILNEIIGGEKNFSIHTDHHGDKKIAASGCGHWQQINLDPAAYKLETEQIKLIQKLIDQAKKNRANEVILEGEHLEGAVLLVSGDWGILPRYNLQFEGGSSGVQVFIYHQTLVDKRHRLLAKKLVEGKAVRLYDGCDDEYLYQVLSEMSENHLMETCRRLAKGLPIYSIKFVGDGEFEVKEMGRILSIKS